MQRPASRRPDGRDFHPRSDDKILGHVRWEPHVVGCCSRRASEFQVTVGRADHPNDIGPRLKGRAVSRRGALGKDLVAAWPINQPSITTHGSLAK
jgi:hypothetical protein